MKIYTLAPNEQWICDRIVNEWNKNNESIVVSHPKNSDIIWIYADWCWRRLKPLLSEKKVVVTLHHIVPGKFCYQERIDFEERDKYVDLYHVPNSITKSQIENLTSKPIKVIPYWTNPDLWTILSNKSQIRKKYNISNDSYLIGSWQRDTEGSDLISPKLEKGPDIFCDKVEEICSFKNNVEVLLSGWRRQYVISRLKSKNIKFHYFEMADFNMLNDFYNMVDLYIVGSRYEGGPQSIFEAAFCKTPILSTKVGCANDLLSKESLFDFKEQINEEKLQNLSKENIINSNYKNIEKYKIPDCFSYYLSMFRELMK